MQNSLLAHIAGNFISEYENVANSSIAYLLNEYPAARTALKELLELEEIPSYFVTELSTDSNGRPDITGLDYDGNKTVIIEGKFWANLTENQPVNYLKELNDNGKLLFLAPEKRLSSLKLELEKKLEGTDSRIKIFSWNGLIDLVEVENNKQHNPLLASDLLQLRELCIKMDSEGMPPLSESDLSPMVGRIASQFSDIVDECHQILKEWEFSNFKGLQRTPTKYGHGFYFRAHSLSCSLSFDTQNWFKRSSQTPFWLKIWERNQEDTGWIENSEKVVHILRSYDPLNSDKTEYGITLRAGMDKNQIVRHIVSKTKEITTLVDGKL